MKDYLIVGLIIAVAVCVGIVGGVKLSPSLGGDFPGGQLPTNLMTGVDSPVGTAAGYVSPVGNLALLSNGGIGAGGVTAANNLTETFTATTSYPSAAVTLAPVTAATSTTSTAVAFTAPGFSVGDACEVSYNGATTTSAFGADAFITAVNGIAVTTTVTFWNGSASAISLTPTSSATGVSSTLKTTCFHTGV
jgi:hypothetical protein